MIIYRLVSVVTIEVAHRIRLIGSIKGEAMVRDQVFAIVVHAEDTIVLGSICCFCVDRVDVFWVLRAISIIIDIG